MNERNRRHEISNHLTVLDLAVSVLRAQLPAEADNCVALHDLLEAADEALARVRVLVDGDIDPPVASPSQTSPLEITTFHIR